MQAVLISTGLVLAACGPSRFSNAGTNNSGDIVGPQGDQPVQELTLFASRDYGPSSWENFEALASVTFDYTVPTQFPVVEGNSGTGWLSLVIGDRKFCYQGNARSNNTGDGDAFVIKKEKLVLSEDCFRRDNDTAFETLITVEEGDSIRLSVNGGGCGSLCELTRVEASLQPIIE